MTSPSTAKLSGYVTTHKALAGRTHAALEDILGFAPGTLSTGFRLYQLAEPVGPNDFSWKDRTRYSDGWHFDSSIGEYVQRGDELRAHLGRRLNYDDAVVDRELAAFQVAQFKKLNVRSGPGRIVKLLPNTRASAFPDSSFTNVPQQRLHQQEVVRVCRNYHLSAALHCDG